jgi:hypothetical protein
MASESFLVVDSVQGAASGGAPFSSAVYPRDLLVSSAFDVKTVTNDYLPLLAFLKEITGQSLSLKVLSFRSHLLIREMSFDDPFLILSYHSLRRLSGKKVLEKYRKIASLVLNHSRGYRAVLCRQILDEASLKDNLRKKSESPSTIGIPDAYSAGWLELLRIHESGFGAAYLSDVIRSSSVVKWNGHLSALRALSEQKVTYACVSDFAYNKASSEGIDSSRVEIIYTSPFIEYGGFYVPESLSALEQEKVRRALLTFKAKTGNGGIIMEFGVGGE